MSDQTEDKLEASAAAVAAEQEAEQEAEQLDPKAAKKAAKKESSRSLNRDRDFMAFWAGETTALIGAEVTLVALPLVAITMLDASAFQLGLLGAMLRLPAILYLVVGVLLDTRRRRPVMITSDLARVVVLLAIPVLAFMDGLNFAALCVAAVILGTATVFFDIAYQAYLPSLVGRDRIAHANGRLQTSHSTAQVLGPSLAGGLVTIVSAASALLFSAVTCLISALFCLSIRRPEPKPVADDPDAGLWVRMREGLRYVTGNEYLRPMILSTGFFMFFWSGIQALYVLYVVRVLDLSTGVLGLLLALGGIGSVVGAAFSISILLRFGPGRTAIVCTIICNPAFLLIPLADGPKPLVIATLAVAQVLAGVTMPIAGVSMGSVRQALTPGNMQSRVASAFRALSLGLAPVGALLAGVLAATFDTRTALVVFGIGLLAPIYLYIASPIRNLHSVPGWDDEDEEEEGATTAETQEETR
ncbi:MFS transporter [Nocardioides speluncae]|uniref:MFS transporter n=1 Tax=Nocardioides speluncae TaxID=2670337 RepID=UPI000D69F91C|nr:MFS transporter [Nocardioides speluncae]